MRIYRIKHIPSGLYLRKGFELTEKGHVYTSHNNTLNCDKSDTMRVCVYCKRTNRPKYEAIFDRLYKKPDPDWIEYIIPKSDFEKEIVVEI